MSASAELLADLRGQGFTVSAMGGSLRVSPRSRLTPALRDAIVLHRLELTAALIAEATPSLESTSTPQTLSTPSTPATGPAPAPAGAIEVPSSIGQDSDVAFRALSLPDCPDCGQTMHRSNVVEPYGRGYHCPNRRCGRVVWIQDDSPAAVDERSRAARR